MKLIKDLLKGPTNAYWDLGRILALVAALMMLGGQVWNIRLGLPLELGPTGLGGGLAAVLGGMAALIFAKDKAGAEARLTGALAQTVEEERPPATPQPKARKRR